MAATAECAFKITITPTTGSVTEEALSFTSNTAPAEVVKGQPVVSNTAFTLDLGDIAAGSGYILWLHAIAGNFYFILGTTSGTPAAANSHLYIPEGQAYPIPINPNATIMTGIRGISDEETTGKLGYVLVGG
jgi:hypothetical protein